MIKTYVLDTNVLIQAPYAVNCFEENYIVLPMVVLEELDNLKKAEGERGANARASIRMLEQLRIKAQIIGIRAEDFITEQVSDRDEQYTGRCEVFIPEEDVKEFKKKGIPVDKAYISDESGGHSCPQLWENQFLLLKADQSVKKTLLGRVQGDRIVPLEYKKSKPYGISPKNSGQYFLQEALMQPADKAPLVIVKGMAGTAKTFYSLAVGLEKLLNNPTGEYRRIIISRPNAQFDADIGFLPGDEQEKISPLMRPVIDNLEQLIDSNE